MGFRTYIKRLDLAERFIRRHPVYYNRATRLFDKLEAASLEDRRAWTETRLCQVLRVAARTKYGKRVYGNEDVTSWPILEKETIRAAPEDFLTTAPWRTSQAATSGTTGTPLRLHRSLSNVSVERAATDRLLRRKGIDTGNHRAAVLRGDHIKTPEDLEPPFWTYIAGGKRLVFSSSHLNKDTLPHYIREIERFGPHVLHAYPAMLDSFCNLLTRADRKLEIPVVMCSSEVLQKESWARAKAALNAEVIDFYGQAERGSFAYAFEPEVFRFLPGYSYNELLPVESGVYELVCTGLWNLAMPLIRFRTGDLVRLPEGVEPEEVAYGTVTFPGVAGRTSDYLVTPGGGRLGSALLSLIPWGVAHIVLMQLIQESPDHVRILVVPEKGFAETDRATLEANARMKLPPKMKWDIELVEDIERNASGKAPYVIRR